MLSQEAQNAIDEVEEAARKLAAARLEYGKRFLFNKASRNGVVPTDKHAEWQTVVDTGDEVTVRQANLKIALLNLEALS